MSEPDWKIRPGREGDAAALATLLRELGEFSRIEAQDPEATRRTVAAALRAALADASHTLFVAERSDGSLAGYLAIHWLPFLILSGPEGFISELFVHPAARGLGLGRALLAAATREAQARGCARLGLINFRTKESYARGFYAQNGWCERAEAANFVRLLPAESA